MPFIENNKGIFSRESLFQNQPLEFSRLLFISQILTCKANCNIHINGKLVSKQLDMEGPLLYLVNKQVIDVQNYFLSIISSDNRSIQGINLIRNNISIEITGEKGCWIDYIRKYTVESNFNENFKIIELISTGGSSDVYKIKSRINDCYFAAKRFCRTLLLSDNFELQALMKEISIARHFSFHQLIKFYTVIEDVDYVYLIMDLINGGELQNSLLVKGIGEIKTLNIVRQLIQIIYYFHKNNIFHRDIKPQNILLQNQDDFTQIFLCDYGLVDEFNHDNNYLFKKCGTPGYTAPEILKEQKYDLRIDMFSLGCIMYLAITGKEPFEGKTKDDIVFKNLSGFVSLLNIKISDNGRDFLSKLLATNPQDRISVFEAINHPWLIFGPGSHPCCTSNNEKVKLNSSRFRLKAIKTILPQNLCRSPQKGIDNETEKQSISRKILLSPKKLSPKFDQSKLEKKLTV